MSIINFSNGFSVCLLPRNGFHSICINWVVKVGAFNPYCQHPGIAHCVEHNIFGSVKLFKNKSFTEAKSLLCPDLKAITYDMYTVYNVRCFSNKHVDIIEFLNELLLFPELNENYFEREKAVIKSEFRNRTANPMSVNAFSAMSKFYSGTMLADPGVGYGTPDQIDNLDFNDVCRFASTHYIPSNSFLVVTGNFESRAVIDKLVKLNGNIIGEGEQHTFEARNVGVNRAFGIEVINNSVGLNNDNAAIEIIFSGCNLRQEQVHAFEVLKTTLCDDLNNSLLLSALREDLGIIYNMEVINDYEVLYEDCGTMHIRFYTSKEKTAFAIHSIFTLLKNYNCTEPILQAAVILQKSYTLFCDENLNIIANKNAEHIFTFGKPYDIEDDIAKFNKMTCESVNNCITKILDSRIVISIMGANIQNDELTQNLYDIIKRKPTFVNTYNFELFAKINRKLESGTLSEQSPKMSLIIDRVMKCGYDYRLFNSVLVVQNRLFDTTKPYVVISTHIDTVYKNFTLKIIGNSVAGTLDNSITNFLILESMCNKEINPQLILCFTDGEETDMSGAKSIAEQFENANCFVVLDVTPNVADSNCFASIENDKFNIAKEFQSAVIQYIKYSNCETDEARWLCEKGYHAFSYCLPCAFINNNCHSEEGGMCEIRKQEKYITTLFDLCEELL